MANRVSSLEWLNTKSVEELNAPTKSVEVITASEMKDQTSLCSS